VSAGGLQPLLLLLRREGEVQEHAARARHRSPTA